MVKFLGIILLITRTKWKKRRELWATQATFKYIPTMNLGRTGISWHRYVELWKAVRWSDQPEERPEGMSSERYWWKLISDFVDRFNEHRATRFIPSDRVCCDESMSKWYGLGGDWINIGLPMYVAIDRKPVNGCEIQNVCCGRVKL